MPTRVYDAEQRIPLRIYLKLQDKTPLAGCHNKKMRPAKSVMYKKSRASENQVKLTMSCK